MSGYYTRIPWTWQFNNSRNGFLMAEKAKVKGPQVWESGDGSRRNPQTAYSHWVPMWQKRDENNLESL